MSFQQKSLVFVYGLCAICLWHTQILSQENPVDRLPEEIPLFMPRVGEAEPEFEMVNIDQIEFMGLKTIRQAIKKQYLNGAKFILARVVTRDVFGEKPYHIHYFDAGGNDEARNGSIEKFKHEIRNLMVTAPILLFILNSLDEHPAFSYFCSLAALESNPGFNQEQKRVFKLYYGFPDLTDLQQLKNQPGLDDFTRALIQYDIGSNYFTLGKLEAVNYLQIAALQNSNMYARFRANWLLGKIYFRSKIAQRNLKQAEHYFLTAANQSTILDARADSLYFLGEIYSLNSGDKVATQKAIDYFTQALNQLDVKLIRVKSAYCLGLIYFQDKGIKQNLDQAERYFSFVIDGTNSTELITGSLYYLGLINFKKNTTESLNMAREYFLSAFYHKDAKFKANSAYYLGLMYFQGMGVKEDINKAEFYLERALDGEFAPNANNILEEINDMKMASVRKRRKLNDEPN